MASQVNKDCDSEGVFLFERRDSGTVPVDEISFVTRLQRRQSMDGRAKS